MKIRIDLTALLTFAVIISVFSGNPNASQVNVDEFRSGSTRVLQDEKVVSVGGGGSSYVPPRVDLIGRDIPMTYLGIGSGQSFTALYLAGRDYDDYAPVYIKNVEVDNSSAIDLEVYDHKVVMTGKEYGQSTVTVDVYHRYYDDIWTTATIPVTVTQAVYIP